MDVDLCLSYDSETLATLGDADGSKSYLFDCVNCGGRYAVRNIDNLNTRPKCHYCRTDVVDIPKITCCVCNINMILPDESLAISLAISSTDICMCSLCAENNGIAKIDIVQVKLHDLLKSNNMLIPTLIGIKIAVEDVINHGSLFSLKDKYTVV